MRGFVAIVVLGRVSVSDAVIINSLAQGSVFDQCISLVDWESKGLLDDITLVARVGDCCPAGTTPGAKMFAGYTGAQIVCGFKADGNVVLSTSSSNGVKTCTYNTCYVMKQHLPCTTGVHQFLNGCCGPYAATTFPGDCLKYKKSYNNAWGESVKYCTTYHKNFGSIGRHGTEAKSDDQTFDGALLVDKVYAYSPCPGSLLIATSGTGGTTTGTTGGTTGTVGTTGTTGLGSDGVKHVIGSLAQGSAYMMCIPIATLASKGLADEIDVYPRSPNGCCRKYTAPGILRSTNIYGGQIVCGTSSATGVITNWASSGNTCNYNECYLMKQDLPCSSGANQFLNGCCGTSSAPRFQSTCLGTFSNTQRSSFGDVITSCTSKLKGVTTTVGTSVLTDDQVDGKLVMSAVYATTACEGSVVLTDAKVSSSYQLRSFVAIIFSLGLLFN